MPNKMDWKRIYQRVPFLTDDKAAFLEHYHPRNQTKHLVHIEQVVREVSKWEHSVFFFLFSLFATNSK